VIDDVIDNDTFENELLTSMHNELNILINKDNSEIVSDLLYQFLSTMLLGEYDCKSKGLLRNYLNAKVNEIAVHMIKSLELDTLDYKYDYNISGFDVVKKIDPIINKIKYHYKKTSPKDSKYE